MASEDRLDDVDAFLLEALQRNGRSTFADLVAAVGLKPPAVHERVKRLEKRGYIERYGARLNRSLLGLGLSAFVSVFTMPDVSYESLCDLVSSFPEVEEIHSVAGEESFVLKVVTRSTAHLDEFLSRLKSVPAIARTKTTLVLSTPFQRPGIAQGFLMGSDLTLNPGQSAGKR